MGVYVVPLVNGYSCSKVPSTDWITTQFTQLQSANQSDFEPAYNFYTHLDSGKGAVDLLKIDNANYIRMTPSTTVAKYYDITVVYNGQTISTFSNSAGNKGWSIFLFGLDDDTKLGYMSAAYKADNYYYYNIQMGSGTRIYYNLLKGYLATKQTANGGGATHIAKASGMLENFSNNLSNLLMVSGGGGGGMYMGSHEFKGADAGGIAGNGSFSANQNSGYKFGLGQPGDDIWGDLDGDIMRVGTYRVGSEEHGGDLKTEIPLYTVGGDRTTWHWEISMFTRDGDFDSDWLMIQGFNPNATVSISTDNGINVTYTGFEVVRKFYCYGYDRARITLSYGESPAPSDSYRCTYESGSDESYCPSKNDFTTLIEALNYVYHKFRNVNLILDGKTIVVANYK